MSSEGVVIHERFYSHSPDRVWRALVDPDELSQWLMSGRLVPTVGSTFTAWWAPLGRIDATVVEVERARRLICLWEWPLGQAFVSFKLRPENGGTRLRLEHRSLGASPRHSAEARQIGTTESPAGALDTRHVR